MPPPANGTRPKPLVGVVGAGVVVVASDGVVVVVSSGVVASPPPLQAVSDTTIDKAMRISLMCFIIGTFRL